MLHQPRAGTARDVEQEFAGRVGLLKAVEGDAGRVHADAADAHDTGLGRQLEVGAFPRVRLVDLEDLLDEVVGQTVTVGQESVEGPTVGDAVLVERRHDAQREHGLLQNLWRTPEQPQARDLPDRLARVDAKGRSVFGAGQPDDHRHQLGVELHLATTAPQRLKEGTGSRRLAEQPLGRDEGADPLVSHDLPAAGELVERAAHGDHADACHLGELGGAGQLVALAQPLLLDQRHDEVVDVLIAKGALGSLTLAGAPECGASSVTMSSR